VHLLVLIEFVSHVTFLITETEEHMGQADTIFPHLLNYLVINILTHFIAI